MLRRRAVAAAPSRQLGAAACSLLWVGRAWRAVFARASSRGRRREKEGEGGRRRGEGRVLTVRTRVRTRRGGGAVSRVGGGEDGTHDLEVM